MEFEVLCSLSDVVSKALQEKTMIFSKLSEFTMGEEATKTYKEYVFCCSRFLGCMLELHTAIFDFYKTIENFKNAIQKEI